jgi:protein SCO1/2
MKRGFLWIGLLAALVLAVGFGLALRPHTTPSTTTASGPPAIGGPFTLVSDTGARVDQSILKGKWSAVFFGYTYCPDVCPTTLTALGGATQALDPDDAKAFQVVFITIDPARDTPAQLKRYLSADSFPKHAVGLTGTPGQIAAVAKAYRVFYQKVPQGGSYVMDHTAIVYLMNPQGQFVTPLDMTKSPPEIAHQIEGAMGGQA